jgi:hypothetical protein
MVNGKNQRQFVSVGQSQGLVPCNMLNLPYNYAGPEECSEGWGRLMATQVPRHPCNSLPRKNENLSLSVRSTGVTFFNVSLTK